MPTFLENMLAEGDLTMLLAAAVVAVGGLLVERWMLVSGWAPYYRLALPLGEELVPIPLPPSSDGKTASVHYAVVEDEGEVQFWAKPGERAAPMGLRGTLGLVRGPGGVHLPARWAPPFTPLLALVWFGGLGATRGQGHITIPIAILLLAIMIVLYRQAAVRAARELRWAFVSRDNGETDSP